MGNYRPLDTRCWEKFLTLKGFRFDGTVKGSHHKWKKKGSRPIPVWGNEKQIPALHLRTGCNTIGCTVEDLYAWADANC